MNKTIIRSALAIVACAAIIGTPLALAADATSTPAATSTDATSTIATTTATTTAPPSSTTTQTITNNAQGDVSSTTSTVSNDGLQESSSTTSIGGAATSTDAGPSITTGDAVTAVNISNVINTAIINSNGLISLLNLFAPILGDVNFSMLNFASTCALCSTGSIADMNNNSSTIGNTLNATSSSGVNGITNNGNSTATIATGNAFAAGNILNIANSSLVNANYLLLVLNNFNSLNGDIVLPGQSFFNTATSTPAAQAATSSIANNNTSTIENGLDVKAEAGGNTASTTGTNTIVSGAATAVSNAINLANTNIMGSEPIFVLVRVFGTWNGKILGTPPGLQWTQTPDGLLLAGPGVNNILTNSTSDVTNNNSADIKNDLHVYALTGDNHIGGTGSGTITTGNATAVGNSINIINTNIVGQNVLFALINIFGDWQGNLTFGAPDVWVGAQADVTSNPLTAGSIIHYHVTVQNHGSAGATNIAVKSIPTDPAMENVTNAGLGTMMS